MTAEVEAELNWLTERIDPDFVLGVALPRGYEKYASVANGRQALPNGGVITEVRGGLSTTALEEFLRLVAWNDVQPLIVGVWAGWRVLDLPLGARLFDLPERPTYVFNATVDQCLKGFSADPNWYLPASLVIPPARRWILAGDIDGTRSYVGADETVVKRMSASTSLVAHAVPGPRP